MHVRLHLERNPDHQISFWCWHHLRLEQEGDDLVTQEPTAGYPMLGACATDKTVFYVGSPEGLCPFCARPPDYTMPFPVTGGSAAPSPGPSAEAPATQEESLDIPSQCPGCGMPLRVLVTERELSIVPASPAPPAEPSATEDAPLPVADGSPQPAETVPAGETVT